MGFLLLGLLLLALGVTTGDVFLSGVLPRDLERLWKEVKMRKIWLDLKRFTTRVVVKKSL